MEEIPSQNFSKSHFKTFKGEFWILPKVRSRGVLLEVGNDGAPLPTGR